MKKQLYFFTLGILFMLAPASLTELPAASRKVSPLSEFFQLKNDHANGNAASVKRHAAKAQKKLKRKGGFLKNAFQLLKAKLTRPAKELKNSQWAMIFGIGGLVVAILAILFPVDEIAYLLLLAIGGFAGALTFGFAGASDSDVAERKKSKHWKIFGLTMIGIVIILILIFFVYFLYSGIGPYVVGLINF